MKWFRGKPAAGSDKQKAWWAGEPLQQLTHDEALELYRQAAWSNMGVGALTAVENLHKGEYIYTFDWVLFGEDISDEQLFLEVLKGIVIPAKGEQ